MLIISPRAILRNIFLLDLSCLKVKIYRVCSKQKFQKETKASKPWNYTKAKLENLKRELSYANQTKIKRKAFAI